MRPVLGARRAVLAAPREPRSSGRQLGRGLRARLRARRRRVCCASARAPRRPRSICTGWSRTRAPRRSSGASGSGQDGNDAAPRTPIRSAFARGCSVPSATSARPPSRAIRDRILESTPTFLRRNIRGKSPSEHMFHLFLAFLHDAGILDQPTPAPTAVHAALRNSLSFVDRLLVGAGASSLQLALVATNGRCFVATGCAYPMHYLYVEGISDCPVCQAQDERVRRPRGGRRDQPRAAARGRGRGRSRRPVAIRLARCSRSLGPDRRARPAALRSRRCSRSARAPSEIERRRRRASPASSSAGGGST